MAIFKCKKCGGDLSFNPGESTGVCDYCGTEQTLPKVMDENIQGLFNRANVLRMKAEFDKAAELYEKILQASGEEAEAYWGLILCKYGIEYVEDPTTFERVPTCHRASYDAVTTDDDYKMALKFADLSQKAIYEKEAKQIDEIQKGIVALAQNEEPYDVFICYKETDESGKRTQDSVIANDIYYQLTQEGFKVFYAAITLEDKLGQEYEPYIFSALNSAKVMLSIGTKPEYFNAVWVKNEWSRFLKIMKKDRSRVLIPCYRDMDAYELPEEFSHLQAQDMGKIGFINDIVRGIKKVIKKETDTAPAPKENAVSSQSVGGTNMEALLKRGRIALEDGEYEKADGFFEEVLNINAECAEAYWGKVLAAEKCKDAQALSQKIVNSYGTVGKKEKLHACEIDKTYIDSVAKKYVVDSYLSEQEIRNIFTYDVTFLSEVKERKNQKEQAVNSLKNNKLLTRARQYATGEIKDTIDKMLNDVVKGLDSRIELAVKTDEDRIPEITEKYRDFLSAQIEKVKEMHQSALEKREADYQSYINRMELASTVAAYNALIEYFQGLNHYKDSDDYIIQCGKEIEKIGETERKESLRRKKVLKTRIMIAIPIVCVVLVASIIAFKWFKYLEKNKINQTYLEQIESLIEDENYDEVLSSLESTDVDAETVATAQELYNKSVYDKASDYLKDGTYLSAIQWFQKVEDYSNSEENILYAEGMMKYKDEDYSSALEYFEKCDSDYLDVADLITACTTHQEFDELCKKAEEKLENYDMKGALKIYKKVDGSDEDVANRIEQIEKYLKFSGNNNKMVYQRKNVKIVIKATLDSDDGFLDLIKYGSSIEYKLKNGKITFKEFGSKYTLTKKKIIKKYKLFSGDQIIEVYYRK